ncbi:PilT/PilU family type 4a pilus ATPase [Pseudolysinimonas sp.]|uniref:type IV pilus twitching motility protein PilT n=1 Tax=Pseudolysinimonas sp. TaxID=2680009 RepID=UPI003F7F8C31
MSSHALDPQEGMPSVPNQPYEIPVGGGAMQPPERVLPTPDAGFGLVDYSQLPPPSVGPVDAVAPSPPTTPAEPSIPGFTPAPIAQPTLLSQITDAPPVPTPAVVPVPVSPTAAAEAARRTSAVSDALSGFPGLILPGSPADLTWTPAPVPPVEEVGQAPTFEVLPPESSRARRSPVATFIEDEYTLEARARVDIELINALEAVVNQGASDLHVSSNTPPMIRVDGALRPIPGTDIWDRERVASALYSLMTDEQRKQFDEHLELDFAFTLSEQSRFRVNYYLQRGAIGGAFRLIPTKIKQLEELGVPDVVSRFAGLPRGLVLVTGPTGSGKSTTLAALIDLVNRTRADHIVTVEDPIEFMHKNKKAIVNQREVGADTRSFANALKHVLRQDPDVILIGELRDLETISVALTAAETGHLVFATLHTQSAAATIDRVIDVYPPHQQDQVRTQLGTVLQGVVTQTLVPRASGEGRAVATEVLVTTPAISNLIREGKSYQITSMMQAGRDLGMHTLDQHLADLVDDGTITREAAFEKSQDPETLTRLIQRTVSTGAPMQFTDDPFGVDQPIGRF